jgi:TRAP-type uncharacterized transport system fused permease subunit
MTAVASLILGLGLPTTANYIIMTSLTATVITNLAGDAGYVVPIIAAHLFVFYFGILADDTPPVGLAAYAASAISRAHPIKTGIQGFTYDMRTALLPFMFFFNTDLLLWNVESYTHGAYIFFTGLIGMFAFTSAIQRWLLVRNRVWEMPVLLLSTLLLLQPLFFIRFFNVHHTVLGDVLPLTAKPFWHALGLACFAGVIFAQSLRRRRASAGE